MWEKRQIWLSEPHFGEVRGGTRLWLMASWKSLSRLCIRINWTFFVMYCRSGVEAKCIQLGCFHRGRPLCNEILAGQGRPPSTILGVRKLEAMGYPMLKTISLCVPSFWHNTGVWVTGRQTDGRTDRYAVCRIYNACKASFCGAL